MAHTFEELVAMQRAADQAQGVQQLREQYGPPTREAWNEQQTATHETAWRDLARDVQAAITAHAQAEGQPRTEVEAGVKKAARHPEQPEPQDE
ncbi:hypothetical protein [Streptomyces mexicanus]|uniref:hypothetical protein n=1 Tax=Streptomyces mexicanus TaxID=178566 RepID=UPI0036480F7C